MNSVEAGAVIAIAVAGWPLYQLVTAGNLDATTALLRWAIIAAACGYGVTLIVRLASRYEAEAEAERAKHLNQLYTDMENSVTDSALADNEEAGGTPRPKADS